MLTYITAFIFYTLAMIGILLIGFIVYKKTMLNSKNENKGMIKILDTLSVSPKKVLMVVKIKNEKFLIASDAERTTFLARLEDEISPKKTTREQDFIQKEQNEKITNEPPSQSLEDSIQRQFRELYSKDEINDEIEVKPDRKEMIKRLLKDLDDDKTKEKRF